MTVKELAESLNGREYGLEITVREVGEAQRSNLVVVYGYSDDNMEFEGSLYEEIGCYDGGSAFVTKNAVYYSKADSPFDAKEIRALWCAPGKPAWSYETDIPHETFNIYEDGEVFCEGIVFSLEDV